MSHKHLNLLRTIFQDPVNGNIHWREIESLLQNLGATVEPAHGARFRVLLNKVEFFLHQPHHSRCEPIRIRRAGQSAVSAVRSDCNSLRNMILSSCSRALISRFSALLLP